MTFYLKIRRYALIKKVTIVQFNQEENTFLPLPSKTAAPNPNACTCNLKLALESNFKGMAKITPPAFPRIEGNPVVTELYILRIEANICECRTENKNIFNFLLDRTPAQARPF